MIRRAIALSTALLLSFSLSYTTASQAAEYTLAIQPILPQEELRKRYQPLADYLSSATGHKITISTQRNFTFYWHKMRKGKKGFDLVLDAAHFTDYRTKNMGYTVLAKLPDTVSFSIVTHEDNFIMDVDELTNKRIATMPTPSLGSVRLEELFPNPMRIPIYVWKLNANEVVESVLSGRVDAAIIPTRLASTFDGLNTVMTTEPVPHMAISASPMVPVDVAAKITQALLNAKDSPDGKKMLAELKTDRFDAANNDTYAGYGELLKGVFGYK
ncbi:MAG: PhnD/SsuA/transferrin family substrate-binding protein [Gammaproteobacteria bacterium]|nr:PhnD/SsuA/transferrin family substrate-binding protein [Gammaproteobacteria bacterium]